MYVAADAVALQQFLCGVQAATWKSDVLGEVLSTADDPWLVPNRHSHGLRPVEPRVLTGREANQAIGQWLSQLCLLEIDEVCQGDGERLW